MAAPALVIRRLKLQFETPPGAAERAARRLAQGLRTGLAARLASRLDGLGGAEDAVLLIPRIVITLDHRADASLDALTGRLADAIAAGIGHARSSGSVGLHFASRAAYTAAFLDALIAGSAWSRWWFHGFDGLRALAVSVAIRTVLSRDWTSATTVLRACTAALRARLWRVIAEADAETVLLGIAAAGPAPDPMMLEAALWDRLAMSLSLGEGLPGPVAALSLLTDLGDHCDEPALRTLAPLLLRLMAQRSTAAAIAATPMPAARTQLPAPLERALERVRSGRMPVAFDPPARWRGSALLGYAMLVPVLDRLPLALACAGWPGGGTARDLVRLIILSACAGPQARLWQEPVWRDLLGVPGPLDDAALARWTRAVGPQRWRGLLALSPEGAARLPLPATLVPGRIARTAAGRLAGGLLHQFAARLPGFAGASAAFLRRNLLGAGGTMLMAPASLRIRLVRPPLDVVLGMAGLADCEMTLYDGTALRLEREA